MIQQPEGDEAMTVEDLNEPGAEARRLATGDGLLNVVAFRDPRVEPFGFVGGDDYCLTYWLPILGPTAVLVHAKLAAPLMFLDELAVPLSSLAAEVGIGSHRSGAWSPLARAVGRLADFYAVIPQGDVLAVRTHLPPLTARQAIRLPAHLRDRHAALMARRAA
jgi:hypothetical protein